MFIELLLVLISLFFLACYVGRRPSNAPPGPTPYPIVGNLVQIALRSKQAYEAFDKLAEEYGDVFSIRIGSKDLVVLTSFEAMRDTLGKDEWSGRIWDEFLASRYLNQRLGMIFLQGDAWKEQRRFSIRHLRDFGFGKQAKMESIIHEELNELMSRLRQKMGDGRQCVIYMHCFFNLSVLNVLWTMMAGVRYSHDDPLLGTLIQKTNDLFHSQKVISVSAAIFPFLRKYFPTYTGETGQVKIYRCLQVFFKEEIAKHRKNESFGSSGHFMDVFLQEVDKGDSDKLYTEDQLVCLLTDFFTAGSETTANTLAFGILYMILNPEVQKKAYKEIMDAVGEKGAPLLEHRSQLPYTEAVIMEIQRMSSIAPLLPPHLTLTDVTYKGFTIPANTAVLVNMYSVNKSKAYWGDPEVFRPERFLDPQGVLVKDERLIPFGIGKRICLGESLAKMSLFLYFTTLIKNFKFETVPGHVDPSAEPQNGLTLSPKPYNVVVTHRTRE